MTAETQKVLLVSGGSRGLGLAIARRYLQRGVSVATFARSSTPEVEQLAREYGDRFVFRTADAADAPAVEKFVAAAWERLGRVDWLVNNAAIGQDALLAHLPPEEIRRIVEINVIAPILLTRQVARRMLLQGHGRIVNVSSICGQRGFPGLAVYSATKGALDAMTRALARELGPRGILVNAIAPGFFESEMSSVLAPEQLDAIRRRTATGRLVSPEDVLPVLDLLLTGSDGITGQVISIDSGTGI